MDQQRAAEQAGGSMPVAAPAIPSGSASVAARRLRRVAAWAGALLVFACTLLLAALPPWMVVEHRWLNSASAVEMFRNLGCNVPWLCQVLYPLYFVLLVPSCLLCVALVWLQRPSAAALTPSAQPQPMAGRLALPAGRLSSRASCSWSAARPSS